MKLSWNKKYTSVTLYTCLLILFGTVCIFAAVNLDAFIAMLRRILDILSPVITGFIIAYLINPFLRFLEMKPLRTLKRIIKNTKALRIISIIISYLFYSFLVTLLLWLVIPQVGASYNDLVSRMDTYVESAQKLLDGLIKSFGFNEADKLTSAVNALIGGTSKLFSELTPLISSYLGSMIVGLRDLIIGVVISVYFLYSKETLCSQLRKLTYALLPRRGADTLVEYAAFTDKTFGGFIVGKLLDSLIIGILSFIVFTVTGIPHYQLLSVVIGVTNIIPFFGPIIGAIPCAFIVFIAEPGKTILFIILIFAIQQLDGNVIGPKILGNSIGISSLGVIIAITVMNGLLGVVGMFIGVPLYVLIVSITRHIVEKIEKKRFTPSGETKGFNSAEDCSSEDYSGAGKGGDAV